MAHSAIRVEVVQVDPLLLALRQLLDVNPDWTSVIDPLHSHLHPR
jgi:hypothetical protein